jgi:hypothetical protein
MMTNKGHTRCLRPAGCWSRSVNMAARLRIKQHGSTSLAYWENGVIAMVFHQYEGSNHGLW